MGKRQVPLDNVLTYATLNYFTFMHVSNLANPKDFLDCLLIIPCTWVYAWVAVIMLRRSNPQMTQ